MEIDKKVDILIKNKQKTTHRTKKMIKGIPLGLIVLFISAILVGAMILTIYSTYTGTMTGKIQGTGIESKWFWDGTPMATQTFSIPMDVTTMTNGDNLEYPHTAQTTDADMDVSFDYTPITDPETVGYGFYFDILDDADVSILDGTTYIKEGTPAKTFTFVYELDENWQESATPIPFDLDVILTAHLNLPPTANPDVYNTAPSGSPNHLDMHVLVNDADLEGSSLTITSVNQGTIVGILTIKGTYPNQYIEYTNSGADEHLTHTATYTIQDDQGAIAVGIITYNYP